MVVFAAAAAAGVVVVVVAGVVVVVVVFVVVVVVVVVWFLEAVCVQAILRAANCQQAWVSSQNTHNYDNES